MVSSKSQASREQVSSGSNEYTPILALSSRCAASTSSVSGRYSLLSRGVRQLPVSAGAQPRAPLRRFSQRRAYTSARPANSARYSACFACFDDPRSAYGSSPVALRASARTRSRTAGGGGESLVSPPRVSRANCVLELANLSRRAATIRSCSASCRRNGAISPACSQRNVSGRGSVAMIPYCYSSARVRPHYARSNVHRQNTGASRHGVSGRTAQASRRGFSPQSSISASAAVRVAQAGGENNGE